MDEGRDPPRGGIVLRIRDHLVVNVYGLRDGSAPVGAVPGGGGDLAAPFLFSFPSFVVFPTGMPDVAIAPGIGLLRVRMWMWWKRGYRFPSSPRCAPSQG